MQVLGTHSSVVVVCSLFVLRFNEHTKGILSHIDGNKMLIHYLEETRIQSDIVSTCNNLWVIILVQCIFSFQFFSSASQWSGRLKLWIWLGNRMQSWFFYQSRVWIVRKFLSWRSLQTLYYIVKHRKMEAFNTLRSFQAFFITFCSRIVSNAYIRPIWT